MKILKQMNRCLALLLAVVMLLPAFSVSSDAAAVVNVTDADLKEYYLKQFNSIVNAVKTDRPGATVLATGEIKQNADLEGDNMAEFANMVVSNVFKNEKSLAADLLDKMNNNNAPSFQTAEVSYKRGALDIEKVPVSGKDYVSGLTTKYPFTMKMLRNETKKTTEILIQFPNCTLLEALDIRKSDLSKVFDLPTNTDILLTDDDTTVLEGGVFQLDDILCTDAYVDIIYNDDMQLITYTSNINYRVSVNTYTLLESIWPTFFKLLGSWGLEVGALADFNIVSIIMDVIGLATGFNPEDSMSSVTSDYNVKYQMYELDWTPRYFGDVNRDNRVETSDARKILRAAVGLEQFKDAGDRFFADLNFDNEISPADARIALRVAVDIEKKFTSYAMRQEQLKGEWEDIETPVIPDTPVEIPDEPEVPEIPIV